MVARRTDMKRKRKDTCGSPILDDSPKRTRVHAQRKFAQGSNVNSPIITPIKELEAAEYRSPIDILPEPVELLPIKRPETELFLTFLSLRGTPILPPSYNFFNTASIVDTNGQVHEIKSESSAKNGPIDISKCASGGCASGSSTTDKPFIAYGVRKRADPIVISRQMDKKRRHALAIQALRRKYQEQKMAKIRALTISKLSEKVTNKTLVRSTNSVSKTETVTKKTNTIQKTKVKVVATTKQHVKVTTTTTQTLQTSLRPKIKPKMCLRSFRGRFVQRELQFRKRPLVVTPVEKKSKGLMVKKSEKGGEEPEEEKTALEAKRPGGKVAKSTVLLKKPLGDVPGALGSRVTRSGQLIANPLLPRRPQIKKRILLTTSKTIVKPRSLRSTTIKKTVISQKKSNTMQIKKQQKREDKPVPTPPKLAKKPTETLKTESKRAVVNVKKMVMDVRKETKQVIGDKCEVTKVEVKKDCKSKEVKKVTKSADVKLKEEPSDVKKETDNKQVRMSCRNTPKEVVEPEEKTETNPAKKTIKKEPVSVKKEVNPTKKEQKTAAVQKKDSPKKPAEPSMKLDETKKESPVQKKKPDVEKEAIAKKKPEPVDVPTTRSSRPSRKTKEAAAIYMELLSQKLVLDSKIDDEDDESIDSFPELPNVKKTEQRENELKAQAKKEDKVIEASPEIVMESSRKSPKLNREELIAKLVSEKTKATRASLESMSLSKKRKSNEADGASTVKLRRSDPPKKSQGKSTEEESELNRRQTRNATYSIKIRSGDDDSDESFHADIKVPRQKKFTRSKALKHKEDSEEEQRKPKDSVVLPEIPVKKPESSDSDQSTTSDINLKVLQTKTKKKFSKTKSITSKTVESRFSDSDEEPLSKLTLKSGEGSREVLGKSAGKLEQAPVKTEGKPKRECAKRPQNYLAMLSTSSSSLEDDLVEETDEGCFLGFEAKPSEVPLVVQEAHPPLSDLLSKDISRRFGKGKVNMSKEQIEKWLKESAMAGVKNENDDMLKFGERIPTETTLEQTKSIDTQKLKTTLLAVGKSEVPGAARTSPKNLKLNLAKPAVDRKLIFRKDKKLPLAPNVNAFSPENESSVYAFGEENEEAVSGPFRRPSRRPSSTATSRSEEQEIDVVRITPGQFRKPNIKIQDTPTPKTPSTSAKDESEGDDNVAHFYIPQNPTKYQKKFDSVPNSPQQTKAKLKDAEEFKYKIPSSPSASSSSSAYISKRETLGKLLRNIEVIKVQKFPCGVGQMVEAPVFHPTEQEFQDPIEYIERIKHKAEQFGICRIVPPSSFKPECKVTDDMRFTAYNQYVHKMLHRWGPNFKELMAIQKYLETQNISLTHAPWIGGMEIDLPRLYQTVQTLGGLKEVIEKKKWPRVSELMKIPKSAQDRVTKLDDIYCKYLLPYDTLSPAEREKLFDEVETDWAKRESKTLLKAQQNIVKTTEESEDDDSDDDEVEECIVKGRNMALNAFYRIARNTMSMHFKTVEPPAHEVEQEFWKHVTLKQNHICVHSGSIDCGNWGYGFAVSKNSPFARHAWNLKVLTNNSGSILRSLGPIMGVTVPTLHVGMVFSACCWYRDPHGLPWIEYLHTGGQKIWYGVPNSESDVFRMALKKLVPNYCRNKELWLPSDTAMIPPSILVENQVSLCRTVQEPGQFVVVFPKVFTSSVSTGYVVSESVYFAPPYWLKTAKVLFDDLQSSCEPPMFSLERLVLSIANDPRTNVEVLRQIIPLVQEICDKEKELRGKLRGFGEVQIEKIPLPQAAKRKRKRLQGDDGDYECEACRKNLFVSMVFDTEGDATYCLEHSISLLNDKKIILKNCKLMFTYDSDELSGLVGKIHTAIECKLQKKLPNKYAGMPTLLTK